MSIRHKKLEYIDESDLRELINNQVPESRYLDYKRQLPGRTDDEKEFLGDVSSFANAAGGDIVYGMSEEKGIPAKLELMDSVDPDKETLRLEGMIRDGIDPHIVRVGIRPVRVNPPGYVFIVRVRKSWNSPHMVTYENHAKFYWRSSAGRYPLDVQDLRRAFLLAETLVPEDE